MILTEMVSEIIKDYKWEDSDIIIEKREEDSQDL